MRIWIAGPLVVAALADVLAQAPAPPAPGRPAFEVASVRRRTGPLPTSVIQGQAERPGGFNRTITAAGLILYAYDLRDHQLIGGPDWMRMDRFDIVATAGREIQLTELRLMVQSLLADRFKLAAHTEQREMPIYTLVFARSDRRLGASIRQSDDACKAMVERPPNLPAGAATTSGPRDPPRDPRGLGRPGRCLPSRSGSRSDPGPC